VDSCHSICKQASLKLLPCTCRLTVETARSERTQIMSGPVSIFLPQTAHVYLITGYVILYIAQALVDVWTGSDWRGNGRGLKYGD
jgi:hypothetical protein